MLNLIPLPLLLLLLLLCFQTVPSIDAANGTVEATSKIVGGQDADPTRYPYYTFLLTIGNEICSGSLIWEDIILTAAHCFRPIGTITAYVNRTSEELPGYARNVTDFSMHPNYIPPGTPPQFSVTEQNDILLLKLSSPVLEVEQIRLNTDEQQPNDNASLTVVGFGLLSDSSPPIFPDNLQDVQVNKVPFDDCNDENSFKGQINDAQMICAAAPGKDACLGDSGGPLILRKSIGGEDIQVGLVSFGEGCADPDFPGGYMRISHYAEWIECEICLLSSNPPSLCSILTPVVPATTPTMTATTPAPVAPTPVLSPTSPVPVIAAPTLPPFLRLQCDDCFCIPDSEGCVDDEMGIEQSFDGSTIALYESFVGTNIIPLQDENGGSCYPFADAVGTLLGYSESNQPQCERAAEEGVCAFISEDSACQGRSYSLQTFASEAAVLTATNAFVTHQGACGVCSSAQDLATRMKTLESFETELDVCRARYDTTGGDFGELQTCFGELGFTSGCASLWSHTVATQAHIAVCATECMDTGPPFNNLADCSLNSCLECTAKAFGDDLERVAGRTMAGSGIVEQVARPCSQFYPVTVDPCPAFESDGGVGFGGLCFSRETAVQVRDSRGTILMGDLKVGDEILVNDAGKFEAVYSFGHRHESAMGEYLQLRPSMLELSSNHLLFVENKGTIPARLVEIGDVLKGNRSVPVTSIQRVKRRGLFAPFTASGTFIANGVQVSCYVAFQESAFLEIGSRPTPISFQWVAQTFQTPHRLWCYHLGRCLNEQYTEDGVSEWVAAPHRLTLWLLDQHPIAMVAALIPFILLMGIFTLLDCIFLRPIESCFCIGSFILVLRKSRRVLKKF